MLFAYAQVKRPVLVEDIALEFDALGGLPSTFIRWFMDAMPLEQICRLVDNKSRIANARCVFGYYDGIGEYYFENNMYGTVAESPAGSGGFGWDKIFIPDGFTTTRAELSEENYRLTYLKIKPFDQVKAFLVGN